MNIERAQRIFFQKTRATNLQCVPEVPLALGEFSPPMIWAGIHAKWPSTNRCRATPNTRQNLSPIQQGMFCINSNCISEAQAMKIFNLGSGGTVGCGCVRTQCKSRLQQTRSDSPHGSTPRKTQICGKSIAITHMKTETQFQML